MNWELKYTHCSHAACEKIHVDKNGYTLAC